MLIADPRALLDEILHHRADADAWVDAAGTATSWADARALLSAKADALRAAGVTEGDVVAIETAESAALLTTVLAAWQLGAAVLPLDARNPPAYRAQLIEKAHASWVVDGVTLRARSGRKVAPGIALLLCTSGSTGAPKCVLLTAAGVLANVKAICAYLPLKEAPRTAIVLPLVYGYALVGQALVTLAAGGTLLWLAELRHPADQWDRAVALGAQGLSSVPTSLRTLARAAKESARPHTLRYVASAGGPLDSTTAQLLSAAFPDVELFNQYGLTEASPRVAAVSSRDPAFALGAAGRPIQGFELWAEDDHGAKVKAGVDGALWVRGPSVMAGYLDDPEGTARVLRPDGALRTGDVGHVDASGALYVLGRADGVVKCGGERVSVSEVSARLRAASGSEIEVVAVEDPQLGHRLVGCFEGTDEQRSGLAKLATALPVAWRPLRWLALNALPRTLNGKVDLKALKERAKAP